MDVEIRVPRSGESVVEATVGRWLKQPGDAVEANEEVVELETDKANETVKSPVAGILRTIARQTGEDVAVDDVLGTITPGVAASIGASNGASNGTSTSVGSTSGGAGGTQPPVAPPVTPGPPPITPPATPTAARIMEQYGLKAADIRGTGLNGKIMIADVKNHLALLNIKITEEPDPGDDEEPPILGPIPPPPPNPLLSDERREIVEPMTRLRKTIAAKLVEAQQTAAMLTTFNEVDMTAVMEIRTRRKDAFKEKHGVNLGFMSFFTKAVLGALKAFPYLNAEIRGDNIIKKLYYDIGIAVGTERGLVVPVVRNADKLTFAGIEKEIGSLAVRARDNKLSIAEISGGTFTITNGGVYGSLMSTPILNAPQVGILGMHKYEERPIAIKGQVVIRPMMYLALSYDHRIVDGGEAVRFLVKVKELLEDPETLLLEG